MSDRTKKGNGPDPVDALVGANVKRWRLLRGMSQSMLAEEIGISFQQLQKYERAVNRFSASRLVRAAVALKVPAAELLGSAEAPVDGETPKFRRLLGTVRALEALDDFQRDCLSDYVRALAKGGGNV